MLLAATGDAHAIKITHGGCREITSRCALPATATMIRRRNGPHYILTEIGIRYRLRTPE